MRLRVLAFRARSNKNQSFLLSRSSSILLLPTLETRDTIKETLDSLATRSELFDDLIISVNGLSSDDVRSVVEGSGLTCRRRIHLLCTRQLISAVLHFQFICKYISSVFTEESLVFLMADDDLIPSSFPLGDYLDACSVHRTITVGMGNLVTFADQQGPLIDIEQHLLPGERIAGLEFLRRNRQGHLCTNMSSMVVPCRVLCDSIDFMARWGSAGRRFEYILATHHSVAALFSPSAPSAMIRQHSQQEGRILSLDSMRRDELIYIAWVWLNQPSTRPWCDLRNKYGFTLLRFVRIAFSLVKFTLQEWFRFGEPS
jgi:hypothetical protein